MRAHEATKGTAETEMCTAAVLSRLCFAVYYYAWFACICRCAVVKLLQQVSFNAGGAGAGLCQEEMLQGWLQPHQLIN